MTATEGVETQTVRAAVVGSPVAHSLSPVLHRAAYAVLGLRGWRYDAYDVTAAALPGFLDDLDRLDGVAERWAGLSLTMPLKASVLPLLGTVSELAAAVGAVNTVLLGGDRRHGENTDVPGLVTALRAAGVETVARGLVLGGGATAASALAALRDLGERAPTVLVRDPARAGALLAAAGRLGTRMDLRGRSEHGWADPAAVAEADLVLATTPRGGTDALAAALPDRVHGVLFDVVYDPWPTPLARAWEDRGGRVVGGLDLLVHQAVDQLVLMTGRAVDRPALAATLRDAAESARRTA